MNKKSSFGLLVLLGECSLFDKKNAKWASDNTGIEYPNKPMC